MSDYLRDLIRRGAGLPREDDARPAEMPELALGDQGLEELVEQADPTNALPAQTEPLPAVLAPMQPTVPATPAVLAAPVEPIVFEAPLARPAEPPEYATEPVPALPKTAAADQPMGLIVAEAPASPAVHPIDARPVPDVALQPSAHPPVELTHALPIPPVVGADPEAVGGGMAPPAPGLQVEAGPVLREPAPAPGATRPVMRTVPPAPAEHAAPPSADPEVAVHIGRLEVRLSPPPTPQLPVLPPARPDWRRGFPEHPPADRYRRARWH